MKTIQLGNTAEIDPAPRKGSKSTYYSWNIFVDEDSEVLNQIEDVTYILHPSFPNPVRTVTDPSNGFSLRSKGWGEFEVAARIRFKDGRIETTKHQLDLTTKG